MPEGSMISIGDGLYVGSPNLCFLQMANRLAFPKLLELGFELCGTYALPVPGAASEATDASQTSLYNRKPLTSKKSLIAFAEQMAGVSGAKAALKALHSIADSSASPMETILTILLTLPFRYGGYGFPLPEMNAKIRPAKTAKQNSNQSLYICDLYWPDVEVVAEYDSDTYHTGSDRISHDSQKRNSLEAMGVTVVTVTNRQISSIMQFEKVAKQIAVNMGRRMQYENPQFTQAQLQLRRTLGL
ncbi:MAG: endonuclease domain-containing protein [Eggerthellaceae bacterium]|nr:endonuclease domain-containing protein [Eggerthellaceae bacterium]